jgi:hypothetical protein
MTKYIDANKFRDYLVTARDRRIDNPLYEEELNNLNYAITQLDNQPTADVQPIVHAKWIYDRDGMDWNLGAWKCSKCKQRNINIAGQENINPLAFVGSKFCPHCGARMDGDEHE